MITTYALQRKMFEQELFRNKIPLVRAHSVDEAQGNEWDIVILSLVRSNRRCAAGFCLDPSRMNVAFTRARVAMLVVGNFKCLTGGDSDWR
jgi:superfamily I DNA and/or RNA helicase